MFIYFDEKDYIYGYGSEPQDNHIEVDSVPEEVSEYLGCYKIKIVENTVEYHPDEKRIEWVKEQRGYEKELVELLHWFKWYDEQVIQYQRSTRLGLEFDKNIDELDAQAVTNAARIKELRIFMSTPYSE